QSAVKQSGPKNEFLFGVSARWSYLYAGKPFLDVARLRKKMMPKRRSRNVRKSRSEVRMRPYSSDLMLSCFRVKQFILLAIVLSGLKIFAVVDSTAHGLA